MFCYEWVNTKNLHAKTKKRIVCYATLLVRIVFFSIIFYLISPTLPKRFVVIAVVHATVPQWTDSAAIAYTANYLQLPAFVLFDHL